VAPPSPIKAFRRRAVPQKSSGPLQTFDELNEHPIPIGGHDASDAWPEGLGFPAQKGDAPLPQGRRGRIDVRDAKREAIDSHFNAG